MLIFFAQPGVTRSVSLFTPVLWSKDTLEVVTHPTLLQQDMVQVGNKTRENYFLYSSVNYMVPEVKLRFQTKVGISF